jgi:F0F1-type ATP synthase delta subunit
MKALVYAKALHSVLQDKNSDSDLDKVLSSFFEVVRIRGDEKLRVRILKTYLNLLEKEERDKKIFLVVSDTKDEKEVLQAYDDFVKEGILPPTESSKEIKIDETIIGGFQIRNKKILIDGSYKKNLIELYKSTNNKNKI